MTPVDQLLKTTVNALFFFPSGFISPPSGREIGPPKISLSLPLVQARRLLPTRVVRIPPFPFSKVLLSSRLPKGAIFFAPLLKVPCFDPGSRKPLKASGEISLLFPPQVFLPDDETRHGRLFLFGPFCRRFTWAWLFHIVNTVLRTVPPCNEQVGAFLHSLVSDSIFLVRTKFPFCWNNFASGVLFTTLHLSAPPF